MSGETFAAMLRRLRIEAGISQTALANRAGCDPAYVNRMERPGERMRCGKLIATQTPKRLVVCAFGQVLGLDQATTDRLLYAAGLAPSTDWQTRAERAESRLAAIRAQLDEIDEPTFIRRTG